MNQQKEKLKREYKDKMKSVYLIPLKISGLLRFHAENGKIIPTKISSISWTASYLILWNFVGFYLYFNTLNLQPYKVSEPLIILVLILTQNLVLINTSVRNRKIAIKMFDHLIDIDVILSVEETKFMRDIVAKAYIASFFLSMFIQSVTFTTFVWFLLIDWLNKFAAFCFISLTSIFYYFNTSILMIVSLSMRVRYLNVALIKLAKLDPGYFPKHYFFDGLYWFEKLDKRVRFQKRVENKYYTEALKKIFFQLRIAEIYLRFPLLASILAIITFTLIMVQTLIEHYLYTNDNEINGSNIYSPYWVITCWVYTSFGFIQLDIFYEEIERTKLICTYILLKNSIPPNVIQLAGSILMTISTRSPIISVYGMFEATAGMFIKLITAMMIYIIIQLHISVSTSKNNPLTFNISTTNQTFIF